MQIPVSPPIHNALLLSVFSTLSALLGSVASDPIIHLPYKPFPASEA